MLHAASALASLIWWRLRNAAISLRTHALARADIYSFTAAGKPWTNFEWASDLIFFAAYRGFGLPGILRFTR